MAPTWSYIAPRDGDSVSSDSTSTSKLDTGAIAGIACAAGALFLGGIGLFVVYWRRQKHFNKEDEVCQRPVEEMSPFACQTPPAYTLDYKMNRSSSTTGGSISSFTHSPDPIRPDSFSPLGGMVSAMPTHPAYIPRAFVRGSTPAPLPPTPEEETLRLPPRPSSPPSPPRRVHHYKSQPDDLMIQAYLQTTDGKRVPSEIIHFALSEDERSRIPSLSPSEHSGASSTLPLRQPQHRTGPPPRGIAVPGLAIPTFAHSRPSQPSPPRLQIDTFSNNSQPRTTSRERGMEITAPAAISLPLSQAQLQPFRQKYHQHLAPAPLPQRAAYDEQPAIFIPPTRPAVRERPVAAHTPTIGRAVTSNHRRVNSADKRIGDWIASQPNFRDGRKNHQAEVPPDGDVW